jgi:peptidoglycan/LPS O-acetylase OafA/YrhL
MPRHATLRRVAVLLAWSLAIGLILVTWGPQALRPRIAHPSVERFGAFFLTAAIFVAAYPRRAVTIALASVVFAVALELGQFLAPGRDPRISDAIVKSLGGLCGAAAVHFGLRARRLWRPERRVIGTRPAPDA